DGGKDQWVHGEENSRLLRALVCRCLPRVMEARASIPERRSRPYLWRGALVLFGAGDLAAEHMRGTPPPVRIVEHGACERDHIRLAFGDNRLRLFGRSDQSDGSRGTGRR